MGLMLGNPWGLLGLLGIPAVLFIHILQRKSRVVPVAVLFLLEELKKHSQGGNKIERLRRSIPLWLQLLMVLILTWLLVEPRRVARMGVRRVAVVLDGSASMRAAKDEVLRLLPPDLRQAEPLAAKTEYFVIDSRLRGEQLYHGTDSAELERALRKWDPTSGEHDPAPSLRTARGLVGRSGLVLFVTDHKPARLASDARLFAVGRMIENTGIAGVSVAPEDGRLLWRASLRNYGKAPATRSYHLEQGDSKTPPREITLQPGQTHTVQAPFPEGVDSVTLALSADAFPMDDRAVMQRPKPKLVRYSPPAEGADEAHVELFAGLPGVTAAGADETPDLLVRHYDPLDPVLPDRPACLFVRDPRGVTPPLAGALLAERHPFLDGLNWQGIICQDSMKIPPRPGDKVLLWQGARPLVYLGGTSAAPRLCFNFDPRKSNAARMPAFVITLNRFVDDLRRGIIAEEWIQAECGQALQPAVVTGPGAPELTVTEETTEGKSTRTVPASAAALLRAPEHPGRLELSQGGRLLLRAGVHFADVRESDFTKAETDRPAAEAFAAGAEQMPHEEDPSWRAWVLALLALAALSWFYGTRPRASPAAAAIP